MPDNNYNPNFLETPDPVTGLQRRVGQNFLDHKQTLHERLVLEHNFDPGETSPQNNHGIHRQGSAMVYYVDAGAALPTHRPTGQAKSGIDVIPAKLLDDQDKGRIAIRGNSEMFVWTGTEWVTLDTNPVGFIIIWPSVTVVPNTETWKKCDGTILNVADYTTLHSILGYTYGGDGANTFAVPNLQGVTITGSGSLDFPTDGIPGGSPTGRIKGGTSFGHYAEDQIQTFDGYAIGNGVYAEGNLFNHFSGVFEPYSDSNHRNRALDRTGETYNDPNQGFKLNLAGAGVRDGAETRATSLVMDFYIKAK